MKRGLDALDFKGDVSLDWDKKSHSFVVDLVFYIENKAGQQMEDADGILSDEPIIAFSDAILIYDGKKGLAGYDADDFLACLAFDGKEGWSLAYGKAFLTYLQIIMDNGTRDLLKFFADDEDEVFELEWSDEEFSRLLKNAESENDFKMTQAIKEELKETMMPYMMPQRFVYVETLPLTQNGKVDRKSLMKEVNR